MIATYGAVFAVCVASLAIGQAAIRLCGVRSWSWLAPPVGLALLCAICWATVRLPGSGATSAAVVALGSVAGLVFLRGRLGSAGEGLRPAVLVAIGALVAASLPFIVEGRFGILGTGFNPDMSQHLLATDRLADGADSGLLRQGYPLGPHAIVTALNKGLGIGLVQGFSGLTLAVAILAPLTALSAFTGQPPLRRAAAALLVGIPYLVASYYAQGAFKETMQALFVLAFVLILREAMRDRGWRGSQLRFVPAAIIAFGAVYTYSFPGLVWLAGIAAAWMGIGLARGRLSGPTGLPALSLALLAFAIGTLPELGRMIAFQRFETFDPSGPGLGNLFGQISPFTALGIWFSGDFRIAAGDGAVPQIAFYLGAAFATALFAHGVVRLVRVREPEILAGALVGIGVYLAVRVGGTPYTAAKALEVAAPLCTLAILLPLLAMVSGVGLSSRRLAGRDPESTGVAVGRFRAAASSLALYGLLAGGCSLLALVNAPVGPTAYSPVLTGLRPLVADYSTLVLAPEGLLAEEHGFPYITWELRGGRVCVRSEAGAGGAPPPGVRFVIVWDSAADQPFRGLELRRRAGPYSLWERPGVAGGPSPCPRIAVRQARQGPGP